MLENLLLSIKISLPTKARVQIVKKEGKFYYKWNPVKKEWIIKKKLQNKLNFINLIYKSMVDAMGELTSILGMKVSYMIMVQYCVCHVMVR